MSLGSALLTVSLLLVAQSGEPLVLPGATQDALPPPRAPAITLDPSLAPIQPAGGVVSGAAPLLENTQSVLTGPCATAPSVTGWPRKMIWGEMDVKAFPDAGRIAPNGISYGPLFTLDMDFNIWLWKRQGLYAFGYARFWGERGTPGQTQGNFDYTRREFDINVGVAWNYAGPLELRFLGYSRENFNRGVSLVSPGGTTNDGAGVEQRLYLNEEYTRLGQEGYNISRAAFVSIGYLPTKSMMGGDGIQFHPGAFGHAYLTQDLVFPWCYAFLDLLLYCDKSFTPRRLDSDVGIAFAPFEGFRLLEFRLGSEFNTGFTSGGVRNMSLPYFSVRLNY